MVKRTLGCIALIAIALRGQTRDSDQVLAAALDHLLVDSEKLSRISCTETIDRSYFIRVNVSAATPSCDQLHVDLKHGRDKLRLFATDRLRLRVSIDAASEHLSWMDALPFESHPIEELLAAGPIGTGPFAAFIRDIFLSDRAFIDSAGEQGNDFKYRFRKSQGSTHYEARAGSDWRSTGESGSFLINRDSKMLEQLVVETSTLPPETSMCEANVTVNYGPALVGTDDLLLRARPSGVIC